MKLEELEAAARAREERPDASGDRSRDRYTDGDLAAEKTAPGAPIAAPPQSNGKITHILAGLFLSMLFLAALPVSIAPYFTPDVFAALGIPQEMSVYVWTGIEWLLLLSGLGLSAPAWTGGAGDLIRLRPTSRTLYICTLANLTMLAALLSIRRLNADVPTEQLLPTATITLCTCLIYLGNLHEKRALPSDAASNPSMYTMHTMRSFAIRFIAFSLLLSMAAALCWFTVGNLSLIETITLFFALAALATPAAFPLALPIAYCTFQSMTRRHDIEIKTPRLFESLSDVSIVVYDRSGTVTEGCPFLSHIITEGLSESTLVGLAASLENGEDHPLSPVIMHAALERKARLSRTSARNSFPGLGIEAIVSGRPVRLGKRAWLDGEGVTTSASLITQGDQAAAKGKICVYLATDRSTKGILVFTDELRHDTRRAVRLLEKIGIKSLLLTGDSKQAAKRLARDAGIDAVRSDLTPEDKVREIQLLTTRGHTCLMLAAGCSDVKALQAADISVQCKQSVLCKSSEDFIPDAVLNSDSTVDLPKLIALGKGARKLLRAGLLTAFFVQLLIYLAANVELSATNALTFYPLYLLVGSIVGIALCALQILRLRYWKLPSLGIHL